MTQPLKNDVWKTILSYWAIGVPALLSGAFAVKLRSRELALAQTIPAGKGNGSMAVHPLFLKQIQ